MADKMKPVVHIGLLLFLCSYTVIAQSSLKVTPVDDAPQGFDRLFSKQVDIFGIAIFATRRTPDPKLLHAAGLLAQYLDNDNDGQIMNWLSRRYTRAKTPCSCLRPNERPRRLMYIATWNAVSAPAYI